MNMPGHLHPHGLVDVHGICPGCREEYSPKGYWTLAEASAILGVHPDTLRRQVRLGKLRAAKHGPIWWVTKAEVERYARENRRVNRGPR